MFEFWPLVVASVGIISLGCPYSSLISSELTGGAWHYDKGNSKYGSLQSALIFSVMPPPPLEGMHEQHQGGQSDPDRKRHRKRVAVSGATSVVVIAHGDQTKERCQHTYTD